MKKLDLYDAVTNYDFNHSRYIKFYSALDFSIRVATNNARLQEIISRNSFSYFRIIKEKSNVLRPDIDIFLTTHRSPKRIPKYFRRIAEASSLLGVFRCYTDGDFLLYTQKENSYLIGSPERGKFFISLRKVDCSSVRSFLNAVTLSLESRGFLTLHSAIVSRKNHALLLTGESGSGKTTLAINLIKKGFFYVSDDISLLRRSNSEGIGVYGLAKDLRRDCYLPDIISRRRMRYLPRFIVFPRIIKSKKSRLSLLSQDQAYLRLIDLSQLTWLENKEKLLEQLRILQDLSAQCVSFELLGARGNIEECCKAIAAAVERAPQEKADKRKA
ncbi:MAG: hypothetical protein WC321_06035 [Candidatus Omnitrophota bacterium]|jgi:hypothetical protein